MTCTIRYGITPEDFPYDNLHEVMADLAESGALTLGAIYYTADFRPMVASDVLDVDAILDNADDAGYEALGDAWNNNLWVTQTARDELREALAVWAAKHVDLSGYVIEAHQGGTRQTIEADDIAGYTAEVDA